MKQCGAVTLVFLILCATTFAQSKGVLRCEDDRTMIPAWTAPGSAHVVEQLACGQSVNMLESKDGYFGILLGSRLGYVHSMYVTLLEGEPSPESGHPEDRLQSGHPRYEGAVGLDVSKIRYDEPSLAMKERGMMWGISGEFTERRKNLLFKLDARFSLGDVDYASQSGAFDNIRDYQFEARYSLGYSLRHSAKGAITPFTGLGFRYLHDNLDLAGPGGYDRKSKYLYSPIGIEGVVRLSGGWAIGASGEYDLFWRGWQNSEIGDTCYACSSLNNSQKDGWGARGSIRIIKNLGGLDFVIEPFMRYWDIETSDFQEIICNGDPVGIGWEPANTSREWGTRIGFMF